MNPLRRVRRALRPYDHLVVRRRFLAFGVGTGKTGTTSIATMFGRYRAAHEAEAQLTIERVLARARGELSDRQLVQHLQRRDRRLWLELESSQILGTAIDALWSAFPDAKYLLTVREPRAWLSSTVNHLRTQRVQPWWQDFADHRFGTADRDVGDRAYSVDGLLAHWAHHNRNVLETIPARQLLVIHTDRIGQSAAQIAAFVGVPEETLDVSAAHARRSAAYTDPLAAIDQDDLETRIEHWCRDVVAEVLAAT